MPEYKVNTEQVLSSFLDQMIAAKGEKMDKAQRLSLRQELSVELDRRIEQAMITALPDEKVVALSELMEKDATEEQISEFMAGAGIDYEKVALQAALQFRADYLHGKVKTSERWPDGGAPQDAREPQVETMTEAKPEEGAAGAVVQETMVTETVQPAADTVQTANAQPSGVGGAEVVQNQPMVVVAQAVANQAAAGQPVTDAAGAAKTEANTAVAGVVNAPAQATSVVPIQTASAAAEPAQMAATAPAESAQATATAPAEAAQNMTQNTVQNNVAAPAPAGNPVQGTTSVAPGVSNVEGIARMVAEMSEGGQNA